jgi:WD40 repeat protein
MDGASLSHSASSTGVDFIQRLLGGRWTRPRSLLGLIPLLGPILLLWIAALLVARPAQAQERVPSTRIEFLKYESMATTVALSPDGTHIAVGARNVPGGGSRVVLWNRVTDERVRDAAFPANRPPKLAFDSSGTRLAVAPAQGGSSIWHPEADRGNVPRLTAAPVNDFAFGTRGALGVGGTSGAGGVARVWDNGPGGAPTVLETDGPVRSIAFSDNTADVVLATGPAQVTLWNYRSDTATQLSTFGKCEGEIQQVETSGSASRSGDYSADHFYVVTQRQAECDPDYLCRIDVETRTVTERFRRKNLRNLVALDGDRVAFSRGRHVYTLNHRSRQESIVFQSENNVHDLSYANGRLVVANSNVVVLEL